MEDAEHAQFFIPQINMETYAIDLEVNEKVVKWSHIKNQLLRENYPEISLPVSVIINVENDPKSLSAKISKGYCGFESGWNYNIVGTMPLETIDSEFSNSILRGLLGHEFAHIVNGDLDGLKGILLMLRPRNGLIGTLLNRQIEHKADIETVRRGLGRELIAAVEYVEKQGSNRPPYYYNSHELKELVEIHERKVRDQT